MQNVSVKTQPPGSPAPPESRRGDARRGARWLQGLVFCSLGGSLRCGWEREDSTAGALPRGVKARLHSLPGTLMLEWGIEGQERGVLKLLLWS